MNASSMYYLATNANRFDKISAKAERGIRDGLALMGCRGAGHRAPNGQLCPRCAADDAKANPPTPADLEAAEHAARVKAATTVLEVPDPTPDNSEAAHAKE